MLFKDSLKLTKRRGISQIIGSLFMMALVAVMGSVVLFAGLDGINQFVSTVNIFSTQTSVAVQETIRIDHVRFDPSSTEFAIWIRNTGMVDVDIDRIALVKFDSQELIIKEFVTEKIFPEEVVQISFTDAEEVSLPSDCETWDCEVDNVHIKDSVYNIIVTTVRGSEVGGTFSPYNG